GEEFIILLPMTSAQQAYILAERIRMKVAALRVASEKGEVAVTISIGIVELRHGADAESMEALFNRADEAMYAAKQAGRNCTVILE
ncbi:MAG: GGDEF domain-containing protein, partial [Chloroflexi bacterium]|nr:GGDEF domain-containing protein [Chloroflexota bacterium]